METKKTHTELYLILATAALTVLLIAIIITGSLLNWGWTGFGKYASKTSTSTETTSPQGKLTKTEEYQPPKTLWDWMNYITAGFAAALVGILTIRVSMQQKKTEMEIALDKQQEDVLRAYIEKMSELLLEKDLSTAHLKDKTREVARVHTLIVLTRLNTNRKVIVLQFLYEADLIDKHRPIINLRGADLREVNLSRASLREVSLSGANLSGANLSGANLMLANLKEANLSRTNLNGADLNGAEVTTEQLKQAKSRAGMIYPDGSKP